LLADGLRITRDHPWTGVGRGAFELVEARFADNAGKHRFGFAENEYVQTAADFGIPGALLMLITLVMAGRWMRAEVPERLRERAAAVGIAALAIQNFVDFSWEAAGVAATACVLGAVAFPHGGRPIGKTFCIAVIAAALGLSALTLTGAGHTFEADGQALERADHRADFAAQAETAFRRHPADGHLAALAARRLLAEGDPSAALWLRRALLLSPHDPFAHETAARALLLTGHPAQAALEMRLAVTNATDRDQGQFCSEALALFDPYFDLLGAEFANEPTSLHCLLERVRGLRQWNHLEALARRAPDEDRLALRARVEAAMELGETASLAADAARLLGADSSVEVTLIAARALARAGDPAAAERALETAWQRYPTQTELPLALAQVAIDRGDVARARAVLVAALAHAVDQAAKAALHQRMADAEERAGNAARASAERAEAVRLQQ
jgi:hypothetical protein